MRKQGADSDHKRLIAAIRAYKLSPSRIDWREFSRIAEQDRYKYVGLAQIWLDLYPSILSVKTLRSLGFRYDMTSIAACKDRANKKFFEQQLAAIERDPKNLSSGYLAVEHKFKQMVTCYSATEHSEHLKAGVVFENRRLSGADYGGVGCFDKSRWLHSRLDDFEIAFASSFRHCRFDHSELNLKLRYTQLYPGTDSFVMAGDRDELVQFHSSRLSGEFSSVYFDSSMHHHYFYMPRFEYVAFTGSKERPSCLEGGFARARLQRCSLKQTLLSGQWSEANVKSTAMNLTYLGGDFTRSNWQRVALQDCVLNADFSAAVFSDVKMNDCHLGERCQLGINTGLGSDSVQIRNLVVSNHKQIIDLYLSGVDVEAAINWHKSDVGVGLFDYRQLFATIDAVCVHNQAMKPELHRIMCKANSFSELVDGLASVPKPNASRLFGRSAWKAYNVLQAYCREYGRHDAVEAGVEMTTAASYAKLR